jgi:hypothetical protein
MLTQGVQTFETFYMNHNCSPACECKSDLNAAVTGLAEASRLLSASLVSDSGDASDVYFAFVSAAKARAAAAFAAYRNHIVGASRPASCISMLRIGLTVPRGGVAN